MILVEQTNDNFDACTASIANYEANFASVSEIAASLANEADIANYHLDICREALSEEYNK